MKTHNQIYKKMYSLENINFSYKKARKGKSKEDYVKNFEQNLEENLKNLQYELILKTYKPHGLRRFIVRDPKTRTIHSSLFIDRIVHHIIVHILEPIFEKVFIYDSFASREDKGTHLAIKRFCEFMRRVSQNGRLVKNAFNNNQIIGYCLKADIKSYFDNVDHEILINIIKKKINDEEAIKLIRKVLYNFKGKDEGKGMPLGNYTSQFFANVYLNELDYFIKHELKVKYYIRYVDDFVILHKSKKRLNYLKNRIEGYLFNRLKLKLHPTKSKILPLRNGITFLGYRIFYHYKLLIKRNMKFAKRKIIMLKNKELDEQKFIEFFKGWEGYAKWANTYNLRKRLLLESK